MRLIPETVIDTLRLDGRAATVVLDFVKCRTMGIGVSATGCIILVDACSSYCVLSLFFFIYNIRLDSTLLGNYTIITLKKALQKIERNNTVVTDTTQ